MQNAAVFAAGVLATVAIAAAVVLPAMAAVANPWLNGSLCSAGEGAGISAAFGQDFVAAMLPEPPMADLCSWCGSVHAARQSSGVCGLSCTSQPHSHHLDTDECCAGLENLIWESSASS